MRHKEDFLDMTTVMNEGAFKINARGLYLNAVSTIDPIFTPTALANSPPDPHKGAFGPAESFTHQMPQFTEQLQCANHCLQTESEIH